MAKPGKPQQGSAVKVVEALVRPVVEGMDLRLWDVRFEKEGPDWFLRVLIDRDEPLDTDTCEAVSRAIDPLLDEADPIEQSYYLEVGSPGLAGRLTRLRALRAAQGPEVRGASDPPRRAGPPRLCGHPARAGCRRQCDPDRRGGDLRFPRQERRLRQALRRRGSVRLI